MGRWWVCFFEQRFYYLDKTGGWSFNLQNSKDAPDEIRIIKAPLVKAKYDELIKREIIEKRSSVFEGITKNLNAGKSPLQKFNEVFINRDGHLVFNMHELMITVGNHLKLAHIKGRFAKKNIANKISDTIFTFDDSSTVEIIRTGMIILKSSDTRIPAIYIPSVLDTTLGIATDDEFAGNDYFYQEYQEPLYNIILTDPGPNRLQVVNVLRQHVCKSLEAAKTAVTQAPALISASCSINDANKIKKELEIHKAKVVIKPVSIWGEKLAIPIKVITLPDFFEKYVLAFINNILNHGANH